MLAFFFCCGARKVKIISKIMDIFTWGFSDGFRTWFSNSVKDVGVLIALHFIDTGNIPKHFST